MWITAHRNRLSYLLLALVFAWIVTGPCLSVPAAAMEATLLHDAPGLRTDAAPINPAVVLHQRGVTWDSQLFAAGPPESLVLDLFEGSRHTATLLMSETGPAGDVVWVGHIEGQPNSRVTLVTHGPSAAFAFGSIPEGSGLCWSNYRGYAYDVEIYRPKTAGFCGRTRAGGGIGLGLPEAAEG